ncbi:MAG: DUF368 domain-containing protein [Lachnospiraceae bacterium]
MKGFTGYLKSSVFNIIKGIFVGVANVIPGVSGGTMLVSFGIYDKLIDSVNSLFKEFKKSISFLVPILLGAALGIVGFSYLIEFLLKEYTLPTALAFIGLIMGGLPVMFAGLREKQKEAGMEKFRLRIQDVIIFILFFAIVIVMPMIKESTDTMQTLSPSFWNVAMLFFGGIIAAATMVIPGVSGSMIMMILGFYYGVINLITTFMNALLAFDVKALIDCCILLVPFGIGVILGIVLIAKAIHYLFLYHGIMTYSAIFGLVLASPFAIIMNTGALSGHIGVISTIVGLIVMVVLGLGTYILGKH